LHGLLAERELVPDFSLVDQARRPTRLSQFRGKVVAVKAQLGDLVQSILPR
jgi:hypothetical protein